MTNNMDEPTDLELHTQENWTPLGDLVNVHNPLFDGILFLFGYDYSSNIYLIKGEDYLSIIDPGNDYTAYMQMVELGFKPTDIKKIAVTHGHQDHVMGVIELFRGYRGFGTPDIEIIMHEAGPVEFKQMVGELGCRITEVKGGETINLSGFDLEVIHTPGHTIDGLCFYHAPTKALFTGDTVLPLAMAEPDDKVAGGRMDHYFYSVRTLLKKDIDHVLPGHGGVAPNIGKWVVEETYDGLIKKEVGLETPFLDGAAQLAQKGLLEESLFYVNKELADNPENPEALEFKAFLLNDLGRNQEALEWFDKVLAQKKDHVHALLGKGSALLALGRHEESLEYFDHVLKIDPRMKEAQVYKGMALYLAGRFDEALDLEAFRAEFTDRFKEELAKKGKPEV
jgi:glyoxylase-like metal-dependent hydrolase (beta-lactamase superfamily II)